MSQTQAGLPSEPLPGENAAATAGGAPEPGLRERGLVASAWTVAARPVSIAISVGRSILIAWILVPEDFGLMLIVNAITMGLQFFSDVGLKPCVNQSPRGEQPAFLQSMWTLGILRGALLYLVCLLAAGPVAEFYGEPRLTLLLPIAALSALILPFESIACSLSVRRLQLGRLTIAANLMDVASTVIIVVMTLLIKNVYALALSSALGTLASVLIGHLMLRPGVPHRFRLERESVVEIIRFGRWIFVSTSLMFLATQVDRLLVGKLLDVHQAGLYGLGLTILMHGRQFVTSLTGSVLQPVLAEARRSDPELFSRRLDAAMRRILLLSVGLVVFTAVAARPYFLLLYPSAYDGAGVIAQMAAVGVWLGLVYQFCEQVFVAVGDSASLMIGNAVRFVATAGLSVLGFLIAGLPGFIFGAALGTGLSLFPLYLRMRRHGVSLWRQHVRYALIGAAVYAGCEAVAVAARQVGAGEAVAGTLAMGACACVLGAIVWRERRDDIMWGLSRIAGLISELRRAGRTA